MNNELTLRKYLDIEEKSLLKSTNLLQDELKLFEQINFIYSNPIDRINMIEGFESLSDHTIFYLYNFVRAEMFFSTSCIMRHHVSNALSSVRRSIDATLTAYEIILSDNREDCAEGYKKGSHDLNKRFLRIKAHIEKIHNNDKNKYPLSEQLLILHDWCSKYGSHADFSSMFMQKQETNEKIGFNYFQPLTKEQASLYMHGVLKAYADMHRIFDIFIKEKLRVIDPKWESTWKQVQSDFRNIE